MNQNPEKNQSRKNTSPGLNFSAEEIELAMEVAKQGCWKWNVNKNEFTFDKNILKMMGYPSKEMPKLKSSQQFMKNHIASEDIPLIEEIIKEFIDERRQEAHLNFRLKTKQGNFLWIASHGGLMPNEKNEDEKIIIGVFINITQNFASIQSTRDEDNNLTTNKNRLGQTVIELGTAKNHAFLKSLIDSIPVPIFYKNKDGEYIGCNQSYENFYKIQEKNLIGKTIYDILPKELAERHAEKEKEVLAKGEKQTFESQILTSEGKIHDVIINKDAFYDRNGNIYGLIGCVLDITPQKKAFNKLVQSKEQLKSLSDNSPGIMYRCRHDKNWTMIYINPQIEQISGYPASDFINNQIRSFASIIPDEDKGMIEKTIQESIIKNVPWELEYRIWHKNGKMSWVYEKGQAIKDHKNNSIYLDGFIFDITDRKVSECELELSNEKFKNLVENSSDWIWETTDDLTFNYCSPQISEILGYKAEGITGRNLSEFLPDEGFKRIKKQLNESKENKKSFKNLHEKFKHKDGHFVELEISGSPCIDQKGNINGFRGINRDITERENFIDALKISEMKFQSVWDSINHGIFFQDINGKLIDVNAGLLKISGYTKEELLALRFDEYFDPESLDEAKAALVKLQTEGTISVITKFMHRNGYPYWVKIFVHTTFWGEKKLYQGFVQDITEEKKRNQLLIDLAKFPEQDKNPVLRIKSDGSLLYTNAATRHWPDLERISIGQMVPEKIKKWTDQAYREKKALKVEIKFQEKTFIADFVPFIQEKYINVYATDITFQKNYEEQLEEQAQIIQEAHDSIVVVNLDNNIIEFNPAAEKMYGIKREDALKNNISILFPDNDTTNFKDVLFKELNRKQEYRTITEVMNKSGEIFLCHLAVSLIKNEDGKIKGTIICAIDISEIRKAQQLLYRIIDLLPIRIFWKDKKLRFLGCNKAFAQDAGKKSVKEVIGLTDHDMPWKKEANHYIKDDQSVLNSLKAKIDIEEEQTSEDGTTKWLSTKKVPLTNEKGELLGIVGAYEDITKMKEANVHMQTLIDDLEEYKDLTIDREHKMIALKKEINNLAKQLNKDKPYDLSFIDEAF